MEQYSPLLQEIRQQLTACMISYGHLPQEFLYQLELIVIEWLGRGYNSREEIRK